MSFHLPFAERSARIKRLFIELHGYAYFHNPSEIGNVDSRFIGRDEICERLRTLLTKHQTKSGSYLVTGYRGVGKSSLVARVLSEISSGKNRSRRASRYFRILFPLPFLAMLDVELWNVFRAGWLEYLFFWLPAIFCLTSLLLLVAEDPRRPARSEGFRALGKWAKEHLFRAVWMSNERYPDRRYKVLLQDYLYLSAIQIAALVIFTIAHALRDEDIHFQGRLTIYLGLYAAFVLTAACTTTWDRMREREPREMGGRGAKLRSFLRAFWGRVRAAITNYVNFSHRIYIKINLGKDDIEEIDILRLISRSIYSKYLEFRKFGLTDLWWRLLYLLVLYFAVGLVYYLPPVYQLNNSFEDSLHAYTYLPSQLVGLQGVEPKDLDVVLTCLSRNDELDLPTFWSTLALRVTGTSPRGQAAGVERFCATRFPVKDRVLGGTAGWIVGREARQAFRALTDPAAGVQRIALSGVSFVDLSVYAMYRGVRENLPPPLSLLAERTSRFQGTLLETMHPHEGFRLLPEFPDYALFFYLVVAWVGLSALARRRPFGLVTHDAIIRELRLLNDAIDAQVTREESASGTTHLNVLELGFGKKSRKVYPFANAREIEKRLLEILDEIDRIPRLTVRPNFTFIFDELDKIEPHKNEALAAEEEQEEKGTPLGQWEWLPSSYGATRERQRRILALLSNLKHLFTTAKAKFIFIAGREMYDASLADVSDRHFFMGSIFNEVLYVPSFLRDPWDRQLADVTSTTEAFVCQFLMPRWFLGTSAPWSGTRSTLEQHVLPDGHGDGEEAEAQRKIRAHAAGEGPPRGLQLHRLLDLPQQRRAEEAHPDPGALHHAQGRTGPGEDSRSLWVGKTPGALFLEFGFYDQYTFGLISYLAQPLFLSIHRSNKDYGDKLLVSTSFLLDHLYKFHGFGFSWRNLELLPEIVDVNKAPQLRELIGQIIQFLGSTHIEEIASGLYDFKFRKKITEEITFLSKISEAESAAFNFTLDESLPIKQYYNRKLHDLLSIYRPTLAKFEAGNFINAVAFVRMILGDLHYYDEEFDHAILEYLEAVQELKRLRPEELGSGGSC